MPHSFDFDAQMRMSTKAAANADLMAVLLAEIPGAVRVERATALADRQGTDWWVVLRNGKRVSIDAKVRLVDKYRDDLALETWSVVEKQVVGWSRDPMKQTDYVLWLWIDSGRWRLVPFLLLCAAFTRRWQLWSVKFGTFKQQTVRSDGSAYHSECVFVPTRVLWGAIYRDNVRDAQERAA